MQGRPMVGGLGRSTTPLASQNVLKSDSFLQGWYSAERLGAAFPPTSGLFAGQPQRSASPQCGFAPVLPMHVGEQAASPMGHTMPGGVDGEEPFIDGRIVLKGIDTLLVQLKAHLDERLTYQDAQFGALAEQTAQVQQLLAERGASKGIFRMAVPATPPTASKKSALHTPGVSPSVTSDAILEVPSLLNDRNATATQESIASSSAWAHKGRDGGDFETGSSAPAMQRPAPREAGRSDSEYMVAGGSLYIDGESLMSTCCRTVSTFIVSPTFDYIMGILIVLNAVLLGIQVDIKARQVSVAATFSEPFFFTFVESAFAVIFILEVFIRFLIVRSRFFTSWWNLFDVVVVVSTALEECMKYGIGGDTVAGKLSLFRVARVLRTARSLRVIRVIRAFRELRIVVGSIIMCFRSLAWTLFLLFVMFYAMAILALVELAETAQPYAGDDAQASFRRTYFPNLPVSLLTLYQTVSGGLDWEDASAALGDKLPFSIIMWILFIGFTTFSIKNIVTGMFVHMAEQVHMNDERNVLQEEKANHEHAIAELRTAFHKADAEGKGYITREKLIALTRDRKARKYFNAFDVDRRDVIAFFDLVAFRTERIDLASIDDFIAGCFRLKGPARNMDVVALAFMNRNMQREGRHDSERLKSLVNVMEGVSDPVMLR